MRIDLFGDDSPPRTSLGSRNPPETVHSRCAKAYSPLNDPRLTSQADRPGFLSATSSPSLGTLAVRGIRSIASPWLVDEAGDGWRPKDERDEGCDPYIDRDDWDPP